MSPEPTDHELPEAPLKLTSPRHQPPFSKNSPSIKLLLCATFELAPVLIAQRTVMILKREYARKWLFGLTVAAAAYGGLWFVTEVFGVPQVRIVATKAVQEFASNADTSATGTDQHGARPVQWSSTAAYGPLIVHADFHWQNQFESGDAKNLYLWFFGRTFSVHETRNTFP